MSISSVSLPLFIQSETRTYLSFAHGTWHHAPLARDRPPPRCFRRAPTQKRSRRKGQDTAQIAPRFCRAHAAFDVAYVGRPVMLESGRPSLSTPRCRTFGARCVRRCM